MTDSLRDREILDVIRILSANGESGRLRITSRTREAELYFKAGHLVDARVGQLTGFQAVNAVASMRDANFSFDPSVASPTVSSITPNERVVLKQFFGIETVDPNELHEAPRYSPDDEVTLETSRIPVEALPTPPVPVPDAPPSRSLYRGALVLACLFILIAVAAVSLRNKYRERALPATVATAEQPAAQPVAEVAKVNTSSTPVAAPKVNTSSTPIAKSSATKDLTGKWNIVNTVQKTAYRPFQDMKIGFDLSISQSGKTFTGKGEKVSENGRSLPADSRTPIQVKGSINGDRIEGTFFEEGAMRKTNGRFVWRIDKAGNGLRGTFVSTAAGSSGTSAARKS